MGRFLLTTLCFAVASALVWAGSLARAQEQEGIPPESEDAVEVESAGEKLPPDTSAAAAAGGTQAQVQEEHTVIPGDTLWDLSAKYLNTPWYWPRVWSYNPEITNPHWIYPGQIVRFFPTGELPSMLASREMDLPEQVEEPVEEELPPENLLEMTAGRSFVQAKPVTAVMLARDAFITPEEVEHLGTVMGSREEKSMMAEWDPIYVKFDQKEAPQVGTKYMAIRTERKVMHPVTGDFMGYHTKVLGAVQVVTVDNDIATAVVVTSLDAIYRGDRIAPFMAETNKNVSPKPNAVELRGYILDSTLGITMVGERHLVFLDQGANQGVEEGNVFDVVRREDGYPPLGVVRQVNQWDKNLPVEIVGRVMVVDARQNASTGIVLASLKELQAGDRVLMAVQ